MTHDHHDHDHHDHDHHDHDHDHGHDRQFYGVIPVFLVDDVVATAEYYRDVLGFEVDFIYGEPATYASVSRDDAIINLSRSEPPGRRNSVSTLSAGNGVDAYIVVSDIDDVYEEVVSHGARTTMAPADQDYGMREFLIEDMNGYRLLLGEDIE